MVIPEGNTPGIPRETPKEYRGKHPRLVFMSAPPGHQGGLNTPGQSPGSRPQVRPQARPRELHPQDTTPKGGNDQPQTIRNPLRNLSQNILTPSGETPWVNRSVGPPCSGTPGLTLESAPKE